MLVKELERVTEASELQLLKAPSPNVATLEGRTISLRLVQPPKALAPMLVMLEGITT